MNVVDLQIMYQFPNIYVAKLMFLIIYITLIFIMQNFLKLRHPSIKHLNFDHP